jgi:hypothetical protein
LKLGIASLVVVCLSLAALPAFAGYDNGPINGTVDAWIINFGYVVSDTFECCFLSPVTGFSFGVWEFPGDTVYAVDWSVTSEENGGTVYGHGTASPGGGAGGVLMDQFISSNQYGYNIDVITVSHLDVSNNDGTYWLNLQNASVASGDPVYWDENGGPSSASNSAVGTIPSEAFTIYGGETSGYAPEPGSILLFGSGALGVAGILRRKLGR